MTTDQPRRTARPPLLSIRVGEPRKTKGSDGSRAGFQLFLSWRRWKSLQGPDYGMERFCDQFRREYTHLSRRRARSEFKLSAGRVTTPTVLLPVKTGPSTFSRDEATTGSRSHTASGLPCNRRCPSCVLSYLFSVPSFCLRDLLDLEHQCGLQPTSSPITVSRMRTESRIFQWGIRLLPDPTEKR